MAVLKRANSADGWEVAYSFVCPGCGDHHQIPTHSRTNPIWQFNNDFEKPTFTPSLMVTAGHYVSSHRPGVDNCWCEYRKTHSDLPDNISCYKCHSFITGGQIQFLNDCTHKLAGQTVPLPPISES